MQNPVETSSIYYRALLARDRRFDGRFFVGVRTTGIYCRPICPAKHPLKKNVCFYASAAAAEGAGFRPCRRCRPESSPGTPAWSGTSATVTRALRLLAKQDGENLEHLATSLGLGERQLRRLFVQHLGAPPAEILRVRRLDFARRLVDETRLPLTEIAFASGFTSIRRFNDAFRKRFARPPRELRKETKRGPGIVDADDSELTIRLPYRPPFAWEPLLDFLRARAIPGVEVVSQHTYARTIGLSDTVGWMEVKNDRKASALVLRLHLSKSDRLMEISDRVKALFDLEADPLAIGKHLAADPALAPLVRALPGLRVPGAWDGFEIAVRAILGQQVSVAGATTISGRLVKKYGTPLPHGESRFLFPTPEKLATVAIVDIGIPTARAAAIAHLARAVHEGRLRLDGSADPAETEATLLELPGIGPWTAQYIAMRALRAPDAFPAADLILKRELAKRGLAVAPEHWQPWRAYAALHLWRSSMTAKETK